MGIFFFLFQLHGSTGTSVLLDRVSLEAEGTFKCEVSTYPEFITKSGSKLIRVARIPDHWERPELHFHGKDKLRYKPGDTIDVECMSKGGYPPPNITWFVNGEKAKLFNLEPEHFLPVVHNETEFSDWVNWRPLTFSRLKLVIDSNVMSSGHLKIKCVVSSFQLYHQSNEVSIETFGIKPTPKSVVQRQSNDLEPILEPSASSKSAVCLHNSMIYALIYLLYCQI